MSENILIVDDEYEIADLIEMYLQNENYTVFKYYSANEALHCLITTKLDLAILDIMLPGTNGLALCKKIRESYTFPIIMLTAKDDEADKITGLAFGADDYVTKPFRPLELLARIKAQLRRYKKYGNAPISSDTPNETRVLSTQAGLVLDVDAHTCSVNETLIPLTPIEFKILQALCERKGAVVTSEELFRTVWEDDYYDKSNSTITVHVRHLREKLGDTADKPMYIKTVWGVGYKIEN
jgi:two-component system response regulator VanR